MYARELEEIVAMDELVFGEDAWGADRWAEEMSAPGTSIIRLHYGGELIACGAVDKAGQITSLAVLPAFRRRGYAASLLRTLVASGGNHLYVAVDNWTAIRLYVREGLQVSGVEPNYYGSRRGAFRMEVV